MRFPPNRLLSLVVVAVAASSATACGDAASEPAAPPPVTTAPPVSSESASGASAGLERNQVFTAQDGTQIPFTLVLPAGFQPGDEHPILLALPPGSQGQEEVDAGLARYWEAEALERGWVVVSPVAPGGQLFFEGSERYLPELLDSVATRVRPEGGYYHLAGISNGGLSAFKVATENAELFRSLIALPGHAPDRESFENLGRIASTRAWLLVGSEDESWRASAEATAEGLRDAGGEPTVTVLEGQGHILDVDPAELYDFLEAGRPGGGA